MSQNKKTTSRKGNEELDPLLPPGWKNPVVIQPPPPMTAEEGKEYRMKGLKAEIEALENDWDPDDNTLPLLKSKRKALELYETDQISWKLGMSYLITAEEGVIGYGESEDVKDQFADLWDSGRRGMHLENLEINFMGAHVVSQPFTAKGFPMHFLHMWSPASGLDGLTMPFVFDTGANYPQIFQADKIVIGAEYQGESSVGLAAGATGMVKWSLVSVTACNEIGSFLENPMVIEHRVLVAVVPGAA